LCRALAAWWLGWGITASSIEAVEPETERVSDAASLEHRMGRVKLRGSGKIWGDVARLRGGVEVHQLFGRPMFLSTESRFDQETRLPYDLRHWGGHLGLGWILSDATSLLAKYRLDSYKVFNTGSQADPAFRAVAGRTQTTALGLEFRHDSRDDALMPTRGARVKLGGELAMEWLGGDDDFGRLGADVSVYATPMQEGAAGAWLKDVTLVEHLRVGWVESFGDTDAVPFFERYFVGGPSTVRGHRSRWLTPRGLEDQFVGGEIQLINNVEARKPILTHYFPQRDLAAVVFFDAGRAFRRFSDVGDFGYGVGAGLRYVVRLGPLRGVARADYGFSLDHEGDDATSRLHVTFGVPF
jgi:outer membrane protein insertion porin family